MEPLITKPNSLISSFDTSGFALVDEDIKYDNDDTIDYDPSYFDLEGDNLSNSNRRINQNGVTSVNFETDVFDLGPTSGEYDGVEEDYEGTSSSSSSSFSSSSSLPSHLSTKTSLSSMPLRPSNSKIPIRNVLDIFQELKLSFGRKPQR